MVALQILQSTKFYKVFKKNLKNKKRLTCFRYNLSKSQEKELKKG